MINFLGCSAQCIAICSGALTLALLEHLVERGVISRAEAQSIVQSSIDCLEPRINVTAVGEAVRLMREKVHPLFSEADGVRPN